jgi:hypothetical protein
VQIIKTICLVTEIPLLRSIDQGTITGIILADDKGVGYKIFNVSTHKGIKIILSDGTS